MMLQLRLDPFAMYTVYSLESYCHVHDQCAFLKRVASRIRSNTDHIHVCLFHELLYANATGNVW